MRTRSPHCVRDDNPYYACNENNQDGRVVLKDSSPWQPWTCPRTLSLRSLKSFSAKPKCEPATSHICGVVEAISLQVASRSPRGTRPLAMTTCFYTCRSVLVIVMERSDRSNLLVSRSPRGTRLLAMTIRTTLVMRTTKMAACLKRLLAMTNRPMFAMRSHSTLAMKIYMTIHTVFAWVLERVA